MPRSRVSRPARAAPRSRPPDRRQRKGRPDPREGRAEGERLQRRRQGPRIDRPAPHEQGHWNDRRRAPRERHGARLEQLSGKPSPRFVAEAAAAEAQKNTGWDKNQYVDIVKDL